MGAYRPDPDETGGPDEPATRIPKDPPTENSGATAELGPAQPNPTPPLPGTQDFPHYPAAPPPDVGGTVYPPPDHPHGSIQRQEPGVTQPRPPTVAEARARDKA
jgi:hypothetical protein